VGLGENSVKPAKKNTKALQNASRGQQNAAKLAIRRTLAGEDRRF
jgi:hypothetical protein